MFADKELINLNKSDERKEVNKRIALGVEEAILKMLKTEGLISESEYTKCIQAFKRH